jgi:imidazolonepropionase-like amidohydrolase
VIDWLRRNIESGRIVGPSIVRVGPFVDGGKMGLPDRLLVSTREEGRDAARLLAGFHVDAIKVHSGVPRDAYFGLLEEARRIGIPVVGHTPVALTTAEVSDAGQRTVEHMSSIAAGRLNTLIASGMRVPNAFQAVEREAPELYRTLVRNGTWVGPTLVAEYVGANRADIAAAPDRRRNAVPSSVQKAWEREWPVTDEPVSTVTRKRDYFDTMLGWAHAMRAAGVKFLAGTDLGVRDIFPGSSLHDELGWLVKGGSTPLEALQAATINAATVLQRDNSSGRIAPGNTADLVILDADPLDDVANVQKIHAVVLRGQLFDRRRLDDLVAGAEKAAPGW